MAKLFTCCCNCGFAFGRSSSGTQTELYCPKCGAELEYTVDADSIRVQLTGKFVDQQTLRIRRGSNRYRQTIASEKE